MFCLVKRVSGYRSKIGYADTHCFEETFLLEQSLETGSTDFLSRGLAPIALTVNFRLKWGAR